MLSVRVLSFVIFPIVCIQSKLTKSTTVKLSCEDVRTLLDQHNAYRKQLAQGEVPGQPKAANMHLMTWDTELAAKAEKYAAKGKFSHNTNREVPSGRFETGENLYLFKTNSSPVMPNVTSPVISWFAESKNYKYGRLSRKDDNEPITGHYTQVVWAQSTYLGCGVSRKVEKGFIVFLYVCYYGPGGNHLGEFPYEAGPGCEDLCGNPGAEGLYGKNC